MIAEDKVIKVTRVLLVLSSLFIFYLVYSTDKDYQMAALYGIVAAAVVSFLDNTLPSYTVYLNKSNTGVYSMDSN